MTCMHRRPRSGGAGVLADRRASMGTSFALLSSLWPVQWTKPESRKKSSDNMEMEIKTDYLDTPQGKIHYSWLQPPPSESVSVSVSVSVPVPTPTPTPASARAPILLLLIPTSTPSSLSSARSTHQQHHQIWMRRLASRGHVCFAILGLPDIAGSSSRLTTPRDVARSAALCYEALSRQQLQQPHLQLATGCHVIGHGRIGVAVAAELANSPAYAGFVRSVTVMTASGTGQTGRVQTVRVSDGHSALDVDVVGIAEELAEKEFLAVDA